MPEIVFTKTPPPEPAAPVPAPALVPEPEPPPTPTAEELQTRAKGISVAMGWESHDPLVADPEPETAPAAPPTPPEPPVEAPPEAPAEAELSTREVIQRTARDVGAEIARNMQPSAPPPEVTPAPAIELTPEDQRDLRIVQYLESSDSRYSGAEARFMAFVSKHYAYQDEWVKANSDKDFNPDDPEHAEWYAKNDAGITADDLEQGRIDMRVEERYKEKVQPKVEAMESKEAYQQALPAIAANVNRRIVSMVEKVDPTLAKLLRDDKGNPALGTENMTKLEDADPVAMKQLDKLGRTKLVPMLMELEKVATPGMRYRLDPVGNPVHAMIDQYRSKAEAEIKALPAAEQTMNGARFMTIPEYQREIGRIRQTGSKDQQEARIRTLNESVWTLSVDQLQEIIEDDVAREAKAAIDEIDAVARKKYGKVQNPPRPEAPAARPQSATPVAHLNGKPRPPSVSSQTDMLTAPQSGSRTTKTAAQVIADSQFS